MENIHKWIVDSQNDGVRLLSFIKKKVIGVVASDIEWSIEHNFCFINNQVERFLSRKVKTGDQIVLTIHPKERHQFERARVLFEDDFILAYNKPHSLDVDSLKKILSLTPIHRLDRDTTGVILFAKKEKALFEDLFRKREITKNYLAIVQGVPFEKKGVIEKNLAKINERQGQVTWGIRKEGLFAKTEWQVEKSEKIMHCCVAFPTREEPTRSAST